MHVKCYFLLYKKNYIEHTYILYIYSDDDDVCTK